MNEKKWILLTGAGTRLGAELARGLVEQGYCVIIHCFRSETAAQTLASELNLHYGYECIRVLRADLTEYEKHRDQFKELFQMECLTAIVHNASSFEPCTFLSMTPSMLDASLNIALRAPILMLQDWVKVWQDEQEVSALPTRIMICIQDADCLVRADPFPAYRLGKVAAHHTIPYLAAWSEPWIRVMGIAIGAVYQGIRESDTHFQQLATDNVLHQAQSINSIVHALVFLCTHSGINGYTFAVDCGRHLMGIAEAVENT